MNETRLPDAALDEQGSGLQGAVGVGLQPPHPHAKCTLGNNLDHPTDAIVNAEVGRAEMSVAALRRNCEEIREIKEIKLEVCGFNNDRA